MNRKNDGELLFEEYLQSQGLEFEYEPEIPGTNNKIDYVIEHAGEPVYLEVKQIYVEPPRGAPVWNAYPPIRNHIRDGVKQFKNLPNTINAPVFVAAPGSFIDLSAPHTMLDAMYGDLVFGVPFNTATGEADSTRITSEFQTGLGRMLPHGRPQNQRISALISLFNYYTFPKEANLYLQTNDGRSRDARWDDVWSGKAGLSEQCTPCVTVWENGLVRRPFPDELFRGPMDARWSVSGENQELDFVGHRRRALGIDDER